MRKTLLYKNNWLELNSGWGMAWMFSKAGYFDERPQTNFYLTCLVTIVLVVPLWLWFFGFGWSLLALSPPLLVGWGHIFISLPVRTGIQEHDPPRWGFVYYGRSIQVYHGESGDELPWFIHMPWDWVHVRSSILLADGSWVHEYKGQPKKDFWNDELWNNKRWKRRSLYRYQFNGHEQETNATVTVSEREHRWKWFIWLPVWPFKRVVRTIDVKFDDPIGPGVGSWKGGVYRTGHKMLPGEDPLQTLRRMEQTRRF